MDFFRRLAGLFGARPQAVETSDAQPDDIVRQICAEVLAARSKNYDPLDLRKSARWLALFPAPPERLTEVAFAALRGQRPYQDPDWKEPNEYWDHNNPRSLIFATIFLADLHIDSNHLLEVLQGWADRHLASQNYSSRILLRAIEQIVAQKAVTAKAESALRAVSNELRRKFASGEDAVQVIARIEQILYPPVPGQTELPPGPFASRLRKWVDTIDPEDQEPWRRFFLACTEADGKAKPSAKWLRKAKQSIDDIGHGKASDLLFKMLDTVALMDSNDEERFLGSHDEDRFLVGLIWASTLLDHSLVVDDLGRFATIWSNQRPGNAALWALSEMINEPRAAAALFRLRDIIKHQGTRGIIDRRLEELAEKQGTTVGALEDFSLPDFDLDRESRLQRSLGGAYGELTVTPTGIIQQWTNESGKLVKSPPAKVGNDFPGDLADFRQRAKDIEAARRAQVLRLEQSWAEERNWTYSDWETHFLRHPLRRPIVGALIWQIDDKVVIPDGALLRDVSGNALEFSPSDRVLLWHPLLSPVHEVLAWRARLLALDLMQPIKQAHREVYDLTEAERSTRTYSNRFAAHILRQHQFNAICGSRGWRYKLQGTWDGWNLPTRTLAPQNMSVEYHVETMDGGETAHSGIYLHLASDQVRFLDVDRQAISLENIPPVVFSEVMRDVDLFVAVTSVANDPNWTDGGPNGQHRDYWQAWAFGELGQTAMARRDLAEWLVPKLSIAGKLEITDKFLIVQGKRQKYAIHFGSSNIQILPSNRYLCIVPDRAPKETQDIKLPFESDSLFSLILSKAFLLVNEDNIKDETILRQLAID
jgi:hypothetical protein